MGLERRSAIQLFGGGLLFPIAGCTADSPDHRRGLSLKLYEINQPPADAQVVELEGKVTEQSLLYIMADLLVSKHREIPREYRQRDSTSISRGTTDQFTPNGSYLRFKSTEFASNQDSTHNTLKELPRYEPESGPWTVLFLQFQDTVIRFEYRILYSTPS